MALRTSLIIDGDGSGAENALRRVAAANDQADAAARRHAYGVRNLGQQFGDMGAMVSAGTPPLRAISVQLGQVGYAMSEMQGRAGAVGAFLTGPWGIALTVATGVLLPLIDNLFESGNAASEGEKRLRDYASTLEYLADRVKAYNKEVENGRSPGQRRAETIGQAGADVAQAQAEVARLEAVAAQGGSRARVQEANAAKARLVDARAYLDTLKLQQGQLIRQDEIERARSAPKPKHTRAKSVAARDEFGRDAADRIAGIADQFSDTPPAVRQVTAAGRQLRDIMDDLARRKPPGFEKLIADAKVAQGAIQSGLTKPLDEFLDSQRQQLAIGVLVNQGRAAEADAARAIYQIEEKRGPLNAAQRAQILASTAALRDQERQLEGVRAVQQANLQALSDMQGIIAQSIYEGPGSLADLPGRMLDSFKRFQAELVSEQVFGEMFRDMRDQVLGASKVDVATSKIVTGFERAANAANTLAGALSGAATPGANAPAEMAGDQGEGDIIVTARRTSDIYGEAIAKGLGRVGLGQDAADKIGRYAGRGLAGAFEGQMASGVAGMLGIKLNGTGSTVGGAIGGLTGIPGAGAAGGILGGLVGNLLTAPKTGSATIGAAGGEAVVTGTGGNSAALRREASGLAAQVTGSLQQIVNQLGGELGSFAVSIGKRGDKFVVDTAGQGRTKYGKANDGIVAYDTAEEAQSAALRDAVMDGAIDGLSAAMTKAIQSSPDIDKAVSEALKVQQVELAIGGIGAAMSKQFADLERQAAERVRIAQGYGFDVLAIEKKNAEDRTKLADQLLKAQVGSLQSLVDEMTSGSLFEGNAIDRLGALNTAIGKAKSDLDAGVEGAADRLANLSQQRLSASKDAYGTTARFAADRTDVLNGAQAAIARTNAQIAAAQSKSDPALATTNRTLDEIADLTTRLIGAQDNIKVAFEQLAAAATGRPGFDLARLGYMGTPEQYAAANAAGSRTF